MLGGGRGCGDGLGGGVAEGCQGGVGVGLEDGGEFFLGAGFIAAEAANGGHVAVGVGFFEVGFCGF